MSALPEVFTARQLAAEPWSPFENERAVYRAHEHGLPRLVIGRKCLYDVAAVRGWLESCRAGDWQAAPKARDHLRRVS